MQEDGSGQTDCHRSGPCGRSSRPGSIRTGPGTAGRCRRSHYPGQRGRHRREGASHGEGNRQFGGRHRQPSPAGAARGSCSAGCDAQHPQRAVYRAWQCARHPGRRWPGGQFRRRRLLWRYGATGPCQCRRPQPELLGNRLWHHVHLGRGFRRGLPRSADGGAGCQQHCRLGHCQHQGSHLQAGRCGAAAAGQSQGPACLGDAVSAAGGRGTGCTHCAGLQQPRHLHQLRQSHLFQGEYRYQPREHQRPHQVAVDARCGAGPGIEADAFLLARQPAHVRGGQCSP